MSGHLTALPKLGDNNMVRRVRLLSIATLSNSYIDVTDVRQFVFLIICPVRRSNVYDLDETFRVCWTPVSRDLNRMVSY